MKKQFLLILTPLLLIVSLSVAGARQEPPPDQPPPSTEEGDANRGGVSNGRPLPGGVSNTADGVGIDVQVVSASGQVTGANPNVPMIRGALMGDCRNALMNAAEGTETIVTGANLVTGSTFEQVNYDAFVEQFCFKKVGLIRNVFGPDWVIRRVGSHRNLAGCDSFGPEFLANEQAGWSQQNLHKCE